MARKRIKMVLPVKALALASACCYCYFSFSSASSTSTSPITKVLAFAPPAPHRHTRTDVPQLSTISRLLQSQSRLNRHYAWPKSSSSESDADTTQQQSSSSGGTNAPFFMQDINNEQQQQQQQQEQEGGYYNNQNNAVDQGQDVYSQQQQQQQQQQDVQDPSMQSSTSSTSDTSTSSTNQSSNSQQSISNVDARVLESILSEGKLNLSTEDEVKRLLEGPRLTENEENTFVYEEDKDSKYKSKVVSAARSDAFWNSVRAKGFEIIDSVGIFVGNRIERDAATLAAIGIFTVERIRKDLGRALPAAGRQARKFLLSTNSTYAEQFLDVTDKTPFALPAEKSLTDRDIMEGYSDMYEELTTPADEIRQVTEAIRDILLGKDPNESSTYSRERRGVKSFAPAGTTRMAERQRRAYNARKKTVLKREQEGVDRKVGRAIGSVTDATWQLRREMQTDTGREAGYRSQGVRNALSEGATKLLEAGREGRRLWLKSGEREQKRKNMIGGGADVVDSSYSSSASFSGPEVMGVEEMPNNVNFVDVDVSPMEEEEIIEDVIEEANLEYAPDGLLSPQSFVEEKKRLVASLESCLSQPSDMWLTAEVVAQATEIGVSLDGEVLREVITTMVTLRDRLQKEMESIENEEVELKIEYVSMEIRRMKEMVDSIAALAANAAGESAAALLKQELEGFVLSDSLDDIIDIELERMEQMLADMVAAREEELRARKQQQLERQQERLRRQQQQQYQQRQQDVVVDTDRFVKSAVVSEVIGSDAVIDQPRSNKNTQWNGGMYTEVEVVSLSDNMGRGNANYDTTINQENGQGQYYQASGVEVVSDTEYSDYEQQFKSAQSAGDDDMDSIENKEESPATEFVLRVVDVIFFVGEKFFFELLPDLITGGARVSNRFAQAQNRGRGNVGWKRLKNVKVKNIR